MFTKRDMDKILSEVNQVLAKYNERITALEEASVKKPATSNTAAKKELDK